MVLLCRGREKPWRRKGAAHGCTRYRCSDCGNAGHTGNHGRHTGSYRRAAGQRQCFICGQRVRGRAGQVTRLTERLLQHLTGILRQHSAPTVFGAASCGIAGAGRRSLSFGMIGGTRPCRPGRIERADSSETIHNGYANGQITRPTKPRVAPRPSPGATRSPDPQAEHHPPPPPSRRGLDSGPAADYAARA